MGIKDLIKMNDEQMRIKIAEACGWRREDLPHLGELPYWYDQKGHYVGGGSWFPIPDYLNSLDAMHEAIRVLDYEQAEEFEDYLCDICKRANDEAENPAPWRFAVVNATARQRAEAFVKTLNLEPK